MLSQVPFNAILVWAATVGAQMLVASRASGRARALWLYLTIQVALSLTGFLAITVGSPSTYAHAYLTAGIVDAASTAVLLLFWLNQLRARSRPSRNGWSLPALLIVGLAFAASHIANVSLHFLPTSFWRSTYALTHLCFTWLALVGLCTPVYCFASLAVPTRRQLFLLLGLNLHIALQAGLIDYLILSRFVSPGHTKLVSDLIYFLPLSVWGLALHSDKTSDVRAETVQPQMETAL